MDSDLGIREKVRVIPFETQEQYHKQKKCCISGTNEMKQRSIKKVVTKVSLRDQKSDADYWLSQTPAARLAALDEIRREYHQWRYGAEPRLQRVYTIVKQK